MVDLVARERPDIVLLDLAMPAPDGFAVLELLSERLRAEPPMRVVLLTGHEHPSITARAGELGAHDVVSKALKRDELVSRLDDVLADA